MVNTHSRRHHSRFLPILKSRKRFPEEFGNLVTSLMSIVILVKVSTAKDDDPIELEIEESSTIEFVVAMVSSLTNHPPELITITVDDQILPLDQVVSELDLGSILYFEANLASGEDRFVSEMFDRGQQERILEQIRQKRIEENFQYAYENNPEAFVSFPLLFIECKINNVRVKAMIDTGAQISILPIDIAKQCQVDYLIDRRYRSTTIGVGAQQSIGRIHALQVQVQGTVWANPFTVLDGTLQHCILGVDWLTKNRAVVNLAGRCLIIDNVNVPFVDA